MKTKYYLLITLCIFVSRSFAQYAPIVVGNEPIKTNEPCIAISPNNPNIVLIGSNVNMIFRSENGGENYTKIDVQSRHGFYGDPVLKFGLNEHAYLCHLSQTKGKSHPEMFDRIVFHTSTDEGKTWTKGTGIGYVEGKVQDKPWICLDERKKSSQAGRIYISWTEFDKYESSESTDSSRIKIAWSDDDGKSFSDPVVVSDVSGNCKDDDETAEGATCTVGRDGTVYCVWAIDGKILMDESKDGGKTWGVDKTVVEQNDGWVQEIKGVFRANSLPFVVSNNKGELYVLWADKRYGDYDVFIKKRNKKGDQWSKDFRINNDKIGNGKDQYMPNICIDPSDQCPYIIYYSKQNSANNLCLDVYVATFKKISKIKTQRITPYSFAPAGNKEFFGDYISISAAQGFINPVWTSNVNNMVHIQTAMLDKKMLKNDELFAPVTAVSFYKNVENKTLLLHYYLKQHGKLKITVKWKNRVVYQRVFTEDMKPGDYEEQIPLTMLNSGIHEAKFEFENGSFVKKFVL